MLENILLQSAIGGKRGIREDWEIITKLIALLFTLFAVTAGKAERIISAGSVSRNEE